MPRENTTAVGSNTLPGDPGTSEEVGEKGARKRDGAAKKINPDATGRGEGGGGGGGTGRSARGEQQQQLLEDLVPPAGKPALPGAGIPFVVTDSIDGAGALGSGDRGGDNGRDGADKVGGGGGRNMSEFERQALQKARARQRERMEEGEPQVRHGTERPCCVILVVPVPYRCGDKTLRMRIKYIPGTWSCFWSWNREHADQNPKRHAPR